jgi:hypothetical protein
MANWGADISDIDFTEVSTNGIGNTQMIDWAFGTGNSGDNIYLYSQIQPDKDFTVRWNLRLL